MKVRINAIFNVRLVFAWEGAADGSNKLLVLFKRLLCWLRFDSTNCLDWEIYSVSFNCAILKGLVKSW